MQSCLSAVRRSWLARCAAGLVLVGVAACQRTAPLDQVVTASSDHGLRMWQAEMTGEFTREEWRDFEAAVQEIKLGVMIRGEASGSAAIWTATLQQIDGSTVRAVLESGLGQKLRRLRAERDKFAGYLVNNDQLRVRPGDTDSTEYLLTLREHQERRLALLNEQIHATEEICRRRGIAMADATTDMPRPKSPPF